MRFDLYHWKVNIAPAQNDIIWENFFTNLAYSKLKSWILLLLLFIVSVIIITPLTLVEKLTPLVNSIENILSTG